MKLTESQLKQIIKEEVAKTLQEVDFARGNLPPRTPGGTFYVDDPVSQSARRGSKNPSKQRVKIFDPKTGADIFDERIPTRGGRGSAAGNRFRHEMEGLYRRAEKVYKKAARFEKIFGDDAVKIMVASAKQGRKAAIKAMVGSVLGAAAAPVTAVYTAVEIADMLANHYIDTYGGGKRLTLPDDQLNDRERRAKQMLEKEVRSSGKILSPADVAAGRFKGVVQPETSAEPAYKSGPNYNPSTGFRESITKSHLKEIIKEETTLARAARSITDLRRAKAEAEARARAGDRAAAPRPYNADEDIHGFGPGPHLTSKQKPKTPEQVEAMLRSQAARLGVDPEVYMANFKKMSPPAQQQSLESGFELTDLDLSLGTGPEYVPPWDWDEEQERHYGAQSPEVQAYKNFGQPDLDTGGVRESKKLTKSTLIDLIKKERLNQLQESIELLEFKLQDEEDQIL